MFQLTKKPEIHQQLQFYSVNFYVKQQEILKCTLYVLRTSLFSSKTSNNSLCCLGLTFNEIKKIILSDRNFIWKLHFIYITEH